MLMCRCKRIAEKVGVLEGTAIETSLYRKQCQVEFERSLIVIQAVQAARAARAVQALHGALWLVE